MSRKKPHTLRSLGREEAPEANANFDTLFRNKLESTLFHDPIASATVVNPFQVQETGRIFFSSNASPTIVKNIAIRSVMGDICFAEAHSQVPGIAATVTDVTASSLTITVWISSTTTLFSSVTTASFGVFWTVIGSTP